MTQCAIPVFEGLLEDQHNRRLLKLLYRTAEWHALAKLRMHSDASLILLEVLSVELGQLLRQFRDLTCTKFATFELPREAAARNKRRKSGQNVSAQNPNPATSSSSSSAQQRSTNPSANDCQDDPPQASAAGARKYMPLCYFYGLLMPFRAS